MAPATRKSAELRAKRAKSTTTAATRGGAAREGADAATAAADDSEEEVTTEEFEVELDDGATWAMNFYECAAEGDVTFLKQILDEGKADMNAVDVDGFTALMIAAAEGHKDIVVELLARGADVAVRTHELRSTALHFAAKNGDAEIVEAICKQDARYVDCWNINAGSYCIIVGMPSDTPLTWACIEGRAECVRVLLAHNADVNVVNQYGATTLICSVMIGEDPEEDESDDARSEIIKMLVAKNPKLVNFQDREGSTAMHLAASCGYLQSVKTLLELGADITLRNAIGQTPLEEAEQTGLEESDVCVDHLRTIWQNLEEEAAARMMAMLEMEEQSAAGSKSASGHSVASTSAVGGAVAVSNSKKSKKKNKKQKRRAVAKQQAQTTGGGVNGVASGDGSGASSLDGKPTDSNEPVLSDESSEEDEDEAEKPKSVENDVPVVIETSEAQAAGEQSDDSSALSGVWTTVGKKQASKFSVAAVLEGADADASGKEVSSAPKDSNVSSIPGGRTSKSPTQKVVPFRRKLKQHRYDIGAPDAPVAPATGPSTPSTTLSSSSNARSGNGSMSTSAPWPAQDKKSASSVPESARASTTVPSSRLHSNIGSSNSTALLYSSTSIFSSSSSSSLFSSPFSLRTQERARGHLGFASSWRSSGFSSGATGSATSGPQASTSGYVSANRSLWKHSQRVLGTQLVAAEAKDKWIGRLHLANENVSEAIGYLACGICGELVNDNLQCSVSVNGSGCAQLYCGTCLAKTLAMTDGLSLKCVKCYQFMNRDEMRPNHFAQAQAASLGLPGGTQQFNNSSQSSSQGADAHLTIDEMKVALESSIPNAGIVDLNPFYLTPGSELAVLSNGQLEILEQAHQLALTQIMETRIANARMQERMQIEEWMKTQRDILHYAAMTAATNANVAIVIPAEDQHLPSRT